MHSCPGSCSTQPRAKARTRIRGRDRRWWIRCCLADFQGQGRSKVRCFLLLKGCAAMLRLCLFQGGTRGELAWGVVHSRMGFLWHVQHGELGEARDVVGEAARECVGAQVSARNTWGHRDAGQGRTGQDTRSKSLLLRPLRSQNVPEAVLGLRTY